jgi:heme-degrading monooxygenase HmoA
MSPEKLELGSMIEAISSHHTSQPAKPGKPPPRLWRRLDAAALASRTKGHLPFDYQDPAVHFLRSGGEQMVACIIEYGIKPGTEGKLENEFAVLMPEIQSIDGFVSMDNFESVTRPGVFIEVSYWRDDRALQTWIANGAHRKAMVVGQDEIFTWYKIQSAEIRRETDWTSPD